MNKYIRKLGFRASDEMEMEVTIKSIRFAWLYVMLFLIGWGILHAIDKSEIPMVQLALVFTAELLYFALQWWFTKKAVNENKAEHHAIKTLKTATSTSTKKSRLKKTSDFQKATGSTKLGTAGFLLFSFAVLWDDRLLQAFYFFGN